MTARLLDGKQTAAAIRAEVAAQVERRRQQGLPPPGLAAVLVGDNPASLVYVRNKHKACQQVGMASWVHQLPTDISQGQLLDFLQQLNADPRVHGILMQLPLPRHIDEFAVQQAVLPSKDVDGFHPENAGLLALGRPRFYPCTPHGVLQLLWRAGYDTLGKEVVIVGRSNIVGKPLALMLLQKRTAQNPAGGEATVTVVHTRSRDLPALCRRAEILVVAAGVPGIITAEMVAPGAIVVDVGIHSVEGRLVGDVHPQVAQVAAALSPVPGGVGPMTIAMLLVNTLQAAEQADGSGSASELSPRSSRLGL
jgi:methylenetetrahydrofolate dehydrogenase (NADP+)/methenyltetrahydrofolate cyclohydrolase